MHDLPLLVLFSPVFPNELFVDELAFAQRLVRTEHFQLVE